VGSGWGASRQVDRFCDTELGVKLVWSFGSCDEARSTWWREANVRARSSLCGTYLQEPWEKLNRWRSAWLILFILPQYDTLPRSLSMFAHPASSESFGVVHQDLKCFPLSLPLFTYLRTSSTAPTTPAVISLTLACKPHPFSTFDHPFTESNLFILRQATSMCIHKWNTGSLLSLCIAIITYALLSGHLTKIPLPSPSKTPTLKLNFRARPCFWSWSSQILPLPGKNWSPRDIVPWLASGLLIGSALFLLLRVDRARKVGRWRDQHPNRGVVTQGLSEEEEKDNISQGDTMPGSFEPARRDPSVPWTEVVGKNLDDFLMLLHVK